MRLSEAQRLALRRQRLMRRAAVERGALLADMDTLRPAFRAADVAMRAAHWVRTHAVLLAALGAALAVVRPRAAWRWGQRAWALWRFWRRTRGSIAAVIQEVEARLRRLG